MKLFLDASVLIAACASSRGASREIFDRALANGWILVATPYVVHEVTKNIRSFPEEAVRLWPLLRRSLRVMSDVVTIDRPLVFSAAKDKPILFGALAWADVLLTLDMADFSRPLGSSIYGLPIMRPGEFLEREREAGRLLV